MSTSVILEAHLAPDTKLPIFSSSFVTSSVNQYSFKLFNNNSSGKIAPGHNINTNPTVGV